MYTRGYVVLGMVTGEGLFEGVLIRKHTLESQERKSSSRSWDKLYCVLHGGHMFFYKDVKHRVSQASIAKKEKKKTTVFQKNLNLS